MNNAPAIFRVNEELHILNGKLSQEKVTIEGTREIRMGILSDKTQIRHNVQTILIGLIQLVRY